MNRGSLIAGAIFTFILLLLGKQCVVKSQGFNFFVEANVLQHFLNQLDGIKLTLGEAIQPPPTDEEVRRAFSRPPRALLSQGDLVSCNFEDAQRQFYLFVKGEADKGWLVIDKSQTDYEGEKRIWLAHLAEGLLWRTLSKGSRVEKVVLIGAAGDQQSTRLSDREIMDSLPTTLSYTDVQTISLRRR